MLALAKEKMGGSGSTLSMRQNNRGASYFRLEGLPSPRAGPTSPPTQSSGVALSPHNIALQVTNSQLYQQLDDHVRSSKPLTKVSCVDPTFSPAVGAFHSSVTTCLIPFLDC